MLKASEEELDEVYQRGLQQGRREGTLGPLLPTLPAFEPWTRGVSFQPLRSWFDSLVAFERGVTENLREAELAHWTLQQKRADLAGEIERTAGKRRGGAGGWVGRAVASGLHLAQPQNEFDDCERQIALAERAQRFISIQLCAARDAVDAELEYGRGYACTVEAMRSAPIRPRGVHEFASVEAFVHGDRRRMLWRADGRVGAGGGDYGFNWRLENPLRRWLTTRWRVSWLSIADRNDEIPTHEVYAIEFPGGEASEESGRVWLMGKIESHDTIYSILPELQQRAQRERNSLVVVAQRVRDAAQRERVRSTPGAEWPSRTHRGYAGEYAPLMSSVAAEELIERAGRALLDAAASPARVILFGSHARGDARDGSDLDFLVIEREVGDRAAESVRLRRALRGFGAPVDVIVLDEALAQRRAKVRGTMVERALREGRVVAES